METKTTEELLVSQVVTGEMTIMDAANLLGVHRTTIWRKVQRYRRKGSLGLTHKLKGRKSNAAKDTALRGQVMELWKRYRAGGAEDELWVADFYRLVQEQIRDSISYSTVLNWLKKDGYIQSRPPRAQATIKSPGELLVFATVRTDWLGSGGEQALLVCFDAAWGKVLHAQLTGTERPVDYFAILERVISLHGIPEKICFADAFTVLRYGGQLLRAMDELGIDVVEANNAPWNASAPAERFRGDFLQALRTHGITDAADAQRYLESSFIPAFNGGVAKSSSTPARFIPLFGAELGLILAEKHEITVPETLLLRHPTGGPPIRIAAEAGGDLIFQTVDVYLHTDKTVTVMHGKRPVACL